VALIALLVVPTRTDSAQTILLPVKVKMTDMKCSQCGHENRPSTKFCTECGTKLQTGCPHCGSGAAPGDKFCSQCGADLSTPKPEEAATTPAEMPEVQAVMAESKPAYPAFSISGFSDVVVGGPGRGMSTGFNLGQYILQVNSALSPKVNVFSELSLTARGDAGTGRPAVTGYNAEVERLIIRLDQSDQLKTSFGRYHTPINYWNTAFHHGLWLQTTIQRPLMTQFGGQFIPVHFIGGQVEGLLPAGGLNINYNAGVGNGRASVVGRGGDAGDVNNDVAWLLNGFIKPDKLFGLQLGGSLYRDRITLASGREFREWIAAAHIVWHKETPEVISEYAHVNHKEIGGANMNSQAYYIQVAYRLPVLNQRLKPYYRFERIRVPAGEPVFTARPSLTGSTFGIRFDIADFVAFKTEYRNLQSPGLPNNSGVFGQLSFAF
jgi:hypothetical protein